MEPKQEKRSRSRVRAERTVLMFSVLRKAAAHFLELAETTKEGRSLNLMACLLYCAFCLEALLNHIGGKRVHFWPTVERKLNPEEKLRVICSVLRFTPDFSVAPFQTFQAAFRFRNDLVHAKTERLSCVREMMLAEGERPEAPRTRWEGLLTTGTARKWLRDTRTIIRLLFEKAGLDNDEDEPHWATGAEGLTIEALDQPGNEDEPRG